MKKGNQTQSKIDILKVKDEKEALVLGIKKYKGWWITEIIIDDGLKLK